MTLQRMVQDAEQHASADAKKKEVTEARNDAESLLYSSQKSLDEYKEKISAEDAEAIESEIKKLESIKDGEDIDAMRDGIQALQKATMKIGESLSKQNADADSSSSEQQADYTDVKKDEKKDEEKK